MMIQHYFPDSTLNFLVVCITPEANPETSIQVQITYLREHFWKCQ